jgi:hypothetical protein
VECVILLCLNVISTSDNVPVNKKDIRMKSAASMLTNVFLASAFSFAASVALSNSAAAELTNCQKNYNQYKKEAGHKAFATTLGNDPGYHPGSCYYVSGYSIKKLAESKAVAECNRVRRKVDGGKCRVIDSQ